VIHAAILDMLCWPWSSWNNPEVRGHWRLSAMTSFDNHILYDFLLAFSIITVIAFETVTVGLLIENREFLIFVGISQALKVSRRTPATWQRLVQRSGGFGENDVFCRSSLFTIWLTCCFMLSSESSRTPRSCTTAAGLMTELLTDRLQSRTDSFWMLEPDHASAVLEVSNCSRQDAHQSPRGRFLRDRGTCPQYLDRGTLSRMFPQYMRSTNCN